MPAVAVADTAAASTAPWSSAADKQTVDPVGPDGKLMMLEPHQLGLVSLERQLQNRLLWDSVAVHFPGLADGIRNCLVPLVAVVGCSFCSVLD